jgi:hypothetical protein
MSSVRQALTPTMNPAGTVAQPAVTLPMSSEVTAPFALRLWGAMKKAEKS